MDDQKLKTAVTQLEQELGKLKSLDVESRKTLEDAVRDVRAALLEEVPSRPGRESLTARLNTAVERFEGSHPNLTGILARLIDGLAELGI